MKWSVWALMLFVVGGCGEGGGDLSPEAVAHVPGGNGVGSGASGSYRVDLTTTSCSGSCPTLSAQGVTIPLCEKGETLSDSRLLIVQSDGQLDVSVLSSALFVTELSGGIDLDGAYEVGGLTRVLEGEVDFTCRIAGEVTADHHIAGTARLRSRGDADGESVDCLGTFEVAGSCDAQCGGRGAAAAAQSQER